MAQLKQNLLSNARINQIVRDVQDELEIAKPLTFLNRVPMGDVYDNSQILATYSGKIYAADIIMNDSEARVIETGKMTAAPAAGAIPNIKIGRSLTQDQLNKISFLDRGLQGVNGDLKRELTAYEFTMARDLVQGVRETMNWLCAAMFLDSFVYDRFNVVASSGFGTPSNLKVTKTGGARWMQANLATMDAITDLQQLALVATTSYGKTFNRVDMSTTMFQLIIQSTAFKNQIRTLRGLEASDPVDISIYNIQQARNLFTLISGFQLNLEDKNIIVKNTDGTDSSTRVVPENKVILSSTDDDGNGAAFQFLQGIPEELTIGRLLQNAPTVGVVQPGICSYYEANPTLNPPDIRAWAVVKGFPSKKDIYSNAVLTVY